MIPAVKSDVGGSIKLWGSFSAAGTERPERMEAKINTEMYRAATWI